MLVRHVLGYLAYSAAEVPTQSVQYFGTRVVTTIVGNLRERDELDSGRVCVRSRDPR